MADATILKAIWEGKVPVCLTLAQEDLACEDQIPPPIYMLLPRISYFPLAIEKAIKQLIQYTNISQNNPRPGFNAGDSATEIGIEADYHPPESKETTASILPEHNFWLESNNFPLKWQYPIGLLYDLYSTMDNVPWKVNVHFTNYPTDVLLVPPVNRSALETHFISMIKEADALKHRSQLINQMQAREHRQLWCGLLHNKFDQFWSINNRLMVTVLTNSTNDDKLSPGDHDETNDAISVSTNKGFRYIPCRLYRNPEVTPNTPGFIQKLISPYQDEGLPTSLQNAINILFPSYSSEFSLLIHGISVPLETPIQWISENMSYPDNFIHIALRYQSST